MYRKGNVPQGTGNVLLWLGCGVAVYCAWFSGVLVVLWLSEVRYCISIVLVMYGDV